MGLTDVLTRGDNEAEVVKAPAFDLTKVLATAAAVVAPLVTLFLNKVTDLNLTEWNWVALILGILGFLAIAGSADVLGRSLATAGESRARAAEAGLARLVRFEKPLPGTRAVATPAPGHDVKVQVLGVAQGADTYFLVKEADKLKWCVASDIDVG